MNKLSGLLAIAFLLISGCNAGNPEANLIQTPVATPPIAQPENPWWNDTVGYEIFVRSYYDSDGDGIGDFNGITEKLNYLNDGDPATTTDLGVTAIWLMPIFPSPSYHGYDVTNYFGVNPQYGTMDDFKHLLDEAHKRGIRVIIDLVLNHTSDEHPWFKVASNNEHSPFRDWYIWSETNPGYSGPWGQTVWHSSPSGFYYGLFDSGMPDLNYKNSVVTRRMEEITRFWLEDIGVDGFRLDAAKHLIENKQLQENTKATHEWYKNYRNFYKSIQPDAVTIAELFDESPTTVDSYTNGDQVDLAFNFELASAYVQSSNFGNTWTVNRKLESTNRTLQSEQYSVFLTNHDQNRVMSVMEGSVEKAKVAASLLMTSPGMPFVYYGEEIGMEGMKPDENIRLPMQWSSEANGGFTTGTPWREMNDDYRESNVADQSNNTDSLLSHYRNLIHLRNAYTALQSGNLDLVETQNPAIFSSIRSNHEESILVIINLSDKPVKEYKLSLSSSTIKSGKYQVLPLFGTTSATQITVNETGNFGDFMPMEEIPAYSTFIYQFQKAAP